MNGRRSKIHSRKSQLKYNVMPVLQMRINIVGLVLLFITTGCNHGAPQDNAVENQVNPITDSDFLTQPLWNDGKAEIAFYKVEREFTTNGRTSKHEYWAATVLVKHDFNQRFMGKHELGEMNGLPTYDADKVSSFQWGFFDVNPDIFWHSGFVTFFIHAAQADLRPLLETQTQISLEGNHYFALRFTPDGTVRRVWTGDALTAPDTTFAYRSHAYPVPLIPLLVRALNFSKTKRHEFWVLYPLPKASYVRARAEMIGTDEVETPEGSITSEQIVVRYAERLYYPNGILRHYALEETYWRSVELNRQILKLETQEYDVGGDTIKHRLVLMEQLRSQWWREDVKSRLKHVPIGIF